MTGLAILVGQTFFVTVLPISMFMGIGVTLLVLGMISIIGGAYAVARRAWWLALIGSISSVLSLMVAPGALSLILVSLAKSEFRK